MTAAAYTDRTTARNYLADMRPVDATGATRVVRVAKYPFTTEPGDVPPNAYFRGWLVDGPTLERGIEGDALGGIVKASNGELKIQLHDGNDWLLGLHWAGRPVSVRMGLHGGRWVDTVPLLTGVMGQPTLRNGQLHVPILSKMRLLEKRFQDNLFAGTGSWEGGEDHEGKTKPALYGWGDNITPELVDAAERSYVISDRAIHAVDAAYSGGNSIADAYTADTADGRITPAHPQEQKPFTIDARGDAEGGFVDSGPRIIQRMLIQRSSLTSADLDNDSFDALHADPIAGGRIGYFVPAGDTRQLDQAVADIAMTLGAWVGEDLEGRIGIVRLDLPAGDPDLRLQPEDLVGGRVEIVHAEEPVWQLAGAYGRNWTPMGPEQIVGAVEGTSRQTYLAAEWRQATPAEDADVLDLYPEAPAAQPVQLLFKDKATAEAELARRFAIRKQRTITWQVEVMTLAHGLRIGALVQLTHPHYEQLRDGALLVLRWIRIKPGDRATLRLWGPG